MIELFIDQLLDIWPYILQGLIPLVASKVRGSDKEGRAIHRLAIGKWLTASVLL